MVFAELTGWHISAEDQNTGKQKCEIAYIFYLILNLRHSASPCTI